MEIWQPIPLGDEQFINWYNFANPPYSSRVNQMTAEAMIRRLLSDDFLIDPLTVEAIIVANQRVDSSGPTIASSIADGGLVQMLPVGLDCGYTTEALDVARAQLSPGFNRNVLKVARLDEKTLFFGLDMPLGVYQRQKQKFN